MENYKNLVKHTLENGIATSPKEDRTGTGYLSVFGQSMKFDLAKSFPLVTLKRTFFRGVVEELLWFLRGETNINSLTEKGVNIWNEWADENGELGPVYGAMWRNWNGIDQISELVKNLKTDPHSRRHIVSGWNVEVLPNPSLSPQANVALGRQALPPCHTLWQVHVDSSNNLHLTLYQRSADLFLGVPFNIASYALLAMLLAHHTGKDLGELTWVGGDCHIYQNHLEQVAEMLSRNPKKLPTVTLSHSSSTPLDELDAQTILLENYEFHPTISAPVAV